MKTPAENKRARNAKWYQKQKSDPEKLARLIKRRKANEQKYDRKQQQREKWASLPADHPRKLAVNQRQKQARANLADHIVASAMGIKVAECPKELIEIKRASMMLCRKLKTRIKTA
jgi:hypothetical protein